MAINYRRSAILLAVLVVVGTGSASPASAAPVGSLDFDCTMTIGLWPGAGSGLSCSGTAIGVMVVPPVVCLPSCPFTVAIDSYVESCPPPVGPMSPPPLFGSYSGRMFAGAQQIGTFNWSRNGTHLMFGPPGDLNGAAEFMVRPPIPTCQQPGPAAVTITGTVS